MGGRRAENQNIRRTIRQRQGSPARPARLKPTEYTNCVQYGTPVSVWGNWALGYPLVHAVVAHAIEFKPVAAQFEALAGGSRFELVFDIAAG